MRPTATRVVIVGAGIGGLCAAVLLASRGARVTVLERGPFPGGKAGIARIDGVEVDTGPSVLTLPAVFDDILREAGTSLADQVELLRPDPACRYVFPGGPTVDVHPDADATRASVRDALGADAAHQLDAFLAYAKRIWDHAAPPFVLGPAPSLRTTAALGPRGWASLPAVDPLVSMCAGIARHVRDPALAAILQRFATYNGSDPRRAPATLNCIAHVEIGLGIHGVRGGIHELVRALVRVLDGLGGELRTSTPVAAVQVHGGRVRGVVTEDGTQIEADAVVVNADVAHLLDALLPARLPHRLTRQPPSMSGWVGIVRAARRPDRVGHTVLMPARPYLEEFADVFDRDRPPDHPTVYVCAQERCHARVGWADAEPLFVMANAPPEPTDGARDPALWDTLQDRVHAHLVGQGAIEPDAPIVWTRSPPGLASAFPGTRGAIYGASSNDRFAAFRRPPNRVRGVPGLYLASGSAHPGGGLPLCALSGRAAARAVARDLWG